MRVLGTYFKSARGFMVQAWGFRLFLSLSLSLSLSLALSLYPSLSLFLSLTHSPWVPAWRSLQGSHIETLIIFKLGSRELTTRNDLYFQYLSKRVDFFIGTNLINHKRLQMRSRWAILYEKSFNLKQSLKAILATLERIIWSFSLKWPKSPRRLFLN